MSYRAGLLTGVLLTAGLAVPLFLLWASFVPRGKPEAAKPVAPASVPKPLKEEELLTLTADAETRLKIKTAAIELRKIARKRKIGAEVMIPPGQTMLVAAPLAGVLRAPSDGVPVAGSTIAKGKRIFELIPLLSPETRTTLAASRIDAVGQVETSQSQVDAAKIALDLETRLVDTSGTRRAINDAQARYDQARKALEAAKARVDILSRALNDADKGITNPISIESHEAGLLRNVNALAGQSVPAGAALFEVVDLKRMWIRAPVFVGEASSYSKGDAQVVPLNAAVKAQAVLARRIPAPPAANPLANTVDLFFEIDNTSRTFHPGERVGLDIPLTDEAEYLTIPWSAVIIDIYGGTWVYEALGEHRFARRRVQVRDVVAEIAVLESGPPRGKSIVIEGAQELFGTEVKFGK